jgi:predicted transcriptional regulator
MKQGFEDRTRRAAEFARRLKETGLSITEFQRRSGLTRNVVYNLSKGQAPSNSELADKLERAFQELGSKR